MIMDAIQPAKAPKIIHKIMFSTIASSVNLLLTIL
jgi:hypothetical protein